MDALLTARGVHKRYHAPVLVDFELRAGEVHALVGDNDAPAAALDGRRAGGMGGLRAAVRRAAGILSPK